MPTWQTEDRIIPEGVHYASTITVLVEPGTGNVQLQRLNSAGAWFTPAEAEYTLAAADAYRIERGNAPSLRIVATGTAQFAVIGD